MNRQRGQIIAELLVSLLMLITFLTLSTIYFEDFKKASYRFMLTQSKENQ